MARVKKDAAKVAAKWARNLQASADTDYVDSTNALTEAPAKRAIVRKATMKARLLESLKDGGAWEKNLGAVTLAEHQEAVRTRGARNLAQAATDKQGNTQNFQSGFLEAVAQISKTIDGMSNVTEADRDARMIANRKAMSALKGRYSKRTR